MRIGHFMVGERPTILTDGGEGWIDFGAILERRGIKSEVTGIGPEQRIVRMLRHGLLDQEFIQEHLHWARQNGHAKPVDVADSTPLLPYRPGKFVCMARNWKSHAAELGNPMPDRPIFFCKTENCAAGPGEAIRLIPDAGRIDHEGELGVVISRTATRVSEADAMDFVLGYLIVNDVTAREEQKQLGKEGFPLYAAKSADTFAPIGPWIVTRDQFEPLSGKHIRVTVNSELRQDGLLDDMHFKIAQIIAAISARISLYPGDIVSTGTPSGVGPIKAGDKVAVEIDGLGRIENPVI